MSFRIVHRVGRQEVAFQLIEKPILGSERLIAPADWPARASPELLPIASVLLGLAEDEGNGVRIDADGVSLPHALIASLDTVPADQLGLPKVIPFVLDLQHDGRLDEPDFRFRVQWRDSGQRPIVGTQRTGAFLTVGTRQYRVPEPQFTIVDSADKFNAAPTENRDARLAFWSRMRPLLPEETQSSVQVSGYLRQTRIAHATRFSLVLKKTAEGISFAPILFGDSVPTDDVELVHEVQSILPPAQQLVFAERRFPAHADARSRYALDAGWYVTLADDVQRALVVVRAAQQTNQATRWAFARNPRAFIRSALGDHISDERLSALFVETFEYSQRVQGEGLWESVVLPWVKKPTEDWLPPESFGIRVGDQNIQIESAQLPRLIEQLEQAKQRGELTIRFADQTIPVSPSTLEALRVLTAIARPDAGTEQPDTPIVNHREDSRRIVLMISTHHDKVEFLRRVIPRQGRLRDGVPNRVKTALKQHQITGLAWLQEAWQVGMPGVLLADDMGLGKTLQALAFLAWRRDNIESQAHCPILVVAPTGVLKNWEEEAERHLHAPQLGILLRAYGVDLKRLREVGGDELEMGRSVLDIRRIQSSDWVLTTYETMRDYQHSFAAVRFDTIVLDEIQKIKTPATLVTNSAKALNGDFVIGLSGTPVENRLADLWCVVDAAYPGFLGDLALFSSTYESDQDPDKLHALKASLTEARASAPPVMLRRMKTDHLPGLPTKHEHVLTEIMPPPQALAYANVIARARASGGRHAILQTLHLIRGLSLHPLHPDLATGPDYPYQSARFKAMLGVLDKIANDGEKALIFLESREMQRYLGGFLQRRYALEHLPLQINGAVTGPERQSRVNRFQSSARGFDVMILSPRAGGVGLTLTAANHVIHLSRWWNPAVEDQCSDRVFRIGQTKDVNIYYPQAVHPDFRDRSFDLTLHELLSRKRRLCTDLLLPPGGSDRDAEDLFNKSVAGSGSASASSSDLVLADIDEMEPTEFEDWALSRLRNAGYSVLKTPWSHDHGADGIGRKAGCKDIVIQCKHSQLRTPMSAVAVTDLLRAKDAYGEERAVLVALTNSDSASTEAVELARRNGIVLVSRADLSKWPHGVV